MIETTAGVVMTSTASSGELEAGVVDSHGGVEEVVISSSMSEDIPPPSSTATPRVAWPENSDTTNQQSMEVQKIMFTNTGNI